MCDPKWTGSIATGRRSGIASVELKHLEAVGVFDSGETEKVDTAARTTGCHLVKLNLDVQCYNRFEESV